MATTADLLRIAQRIHRQLPATQGHSPNGPPWEVYVTDPAEHPDSADWRTEIHWPVR